ELQELKLITASRSSCVKSSKRHSGTETIGHGKYSQLSTTCIPTHPASFVTSVVLRRDRDIAGTRSQCRVAARIWYLVLGTGGLGALYPQVLQFRLGPEQDITSLQTARELCEVAQRVPLQPSCTSRPPLVDVKPNSTVAVPDAVTRVACNQSWSTVSRAAVPLMRTRLLAVGSALLVASPECSSHCSETLRSLP
ncbi:hypothetical protein N431DRAFT_533250, partial [Stipitochalara longipes BDJ]